jgi:hypothetical protein
MTTDRRAFDSSSQNLDLESSDYETLIRVRDRFMLVLREGLRLLRDPRKEEILVQRLGIEGSPSLTLEEIGRFFGITRERVRQLEMSALAELKEAIRSLSLGKVLMADLHDLIEPNVAGWEPRLEWISREVLPSTPSWRSKTLLKSLAKNSELGVDREVIGDGRRLGSTGPVQRGDVASTNVRERTSERDVDATKAALAGELGRILGDQELRRRLVELGSLGNGSSTAPRKGQPWSADEDSKLSEEFNHGWRIEQMMLSHQRTSAGIRARLSHLGITEYRVPSEEIDALQISRVPHLELKSSELYVPLDR